MKTNGVRDVGYMCAYMCESGEGIHLFALSRFDKLELLDRGIVALITPSPFVCYCSIQCYCGDVMIPCSTAVTCVHLPIESDLQLWSLCFIYLLFTCCVCALRHVCVCLSAQLSS